MSSSTLGRLEEKHVRANTGGGSPETWDVNRTVLRHPSSWNWDYPLNMGITLRLDY